MVEIGKEKRGEGGIERVLGMTKTYLGDICIFPERKEERKRVEIDGISERGEGERKEGREKGSEGGRKRES